MLIYRTSRVKLQHQKQLLMVRLVNKRCVSTFDNVMKAVSSLVMPKSWRNSPTFTFSEELESLSTGICKLVGSGHPLLSRISNYYVDGGGKKVRPMLVLLLSRALSEIPVNERDRIRIDYSDICEEPIYSDNKKAFKTTIDLLFDRPVNTISPFHMLHGIASLNPLTRDDYKPLPREFDESRGILPKQRRLAEIVEMIHVASLLHDDVIDHSGTRRGKPSGNFAFTNKMAVLAGDFILGRAVISSARLRNNEVTELLSACIANLVEGEFMQLKNTVLDDDLNTIFTAKHKHIVPPEAQKANEILHDYRVEVPTGLKKRESSHSETIDTAFQYYLHKTYLKTASLISKSCRATAVLAGCRDPVLDECYQFGRNLGLCFQLIDDTLDFTASSKTVGKPAGADLKLGIATAPVLYAWKENPSMGPMIQRNFSEPGDVERAFAAVQKYDGVAKTQALAENYRDKALANLRNMLPDTESRAALEMLTNNVVTRKK